MSKRLYEFRDNCGFGLLADIKNLPSREITLGAITALERMMHRGAVASDGKSGDGCGILFSIPHKFMRKTAKALNIDLPEVYAVASVFLSDEIQLEKFSEICLKNDLKVLFNREVSIDTNALGELALATLPKIYQIFVVPNSIIAKKRLNSLIYIARRQIQREFRDDEKFYINSFSNKSIIYKGLVMPTYLKVFYKDLNDADFSTSFALFHQRFSTNTLPKWRLAQPFRTLAHNGEINSISSNRSNLSILEPALKSQIFNNDELSELLPITNSDRSDSASLDNIFEFMIENGYDFFKSIRSLIPAPWQNSPHTDAKIRAFYEYSSPIFSPWDGPSAVSFTDGRFIACVLDRNGLRPAKYIITKDDKILISSEYGVLDIAEDEILERGRLQSGEMIGIDLKYAKVIKNKEINDYLKNSQNYTSWLNENMVHLEEYADVGFEKFGDYEVENLHAFQRNFGVTTEFKNMVISHMAKDAKEPVGSMGDDTTLAAFSNKQRRFCDFFKQKFAQVTNPPIDPLREKVVMSLNITLGEFQNFLDESPLHAKRIKTTSPILMQDKFEILLSLGDENSPRFSEAFKNSTFYTTFDENLSGTLQDLCDDIIEKIKKDNIHILILDDRNLSKNLAAMPMQMAIGRIHRALIEAKIRHKVSIVAVSGEILDSHSAACMLGYGANALYPYLLYASIYEMNKEAGHDEIKRALKNSHHALNQGLLKIMSKMGISTMGSYRNSALFDVLGLDERVVGECFSPSVSLLGALKYEDIEKRVKFWHKASFDYDESRNLLPLFMGGIYKFLEDEEYHDYTPSLINQIHKTAISGDKRDFDLIKEQISNRKFKMVRDLLVIKSDKEPVDIKEVEPASEIFKRFNTAAMSLGSISPEAHEAMALAMKRLGGMSNSGEGGESDERLKSEANSQIKQIASGRFGVTPHYLISAKEIQIKLAQGAKPGEGGQLPGFKVTPLIATLRYTIPGVTLISPPPHHDIYSIEDLAQLIFDLKQINPKATIAVKLVSSAGVGTIAAGVAKCYADKIIISGGDGGTGAASLVSIKNTGNPWELGLIEAHNTLKVNNLRNLVHLQTDGGLKIGKDIIKAALLGGESYAFGTLALVILGCKILRVCHLNCCSVGVASQDEELREHFVGSVDRLINYFTLLAQDIREELANMGYKSIDEIVGRNDLLTQNSDEFAMKFDVSELLEHIEGESTKTKENTPFDTNEFEKKILKEIYPAIANPGEKVVIDSEISNINRSFGALISGEIAKYYGNNGLATQSIKINLKGIAGQSFGAFLSPGMALYLKGSANDYVGKGMHGGRIIITPENLNNEFACAGNTCLYGATGGKLFVAGIAGERFGVRNSGAIAINEGTGDHACEYMTGGVVIVLGDTGINFAAGMTGGLAFVYDKNREFIDKLNSELVVALRIDTDEMDEVRHYLKRLLKTYQSETRSLKAKFIIENFRDAVRDFWLVKPKDMSKLPLNPADGD